MPSLLVIASGNPHKIREIIQTLGSKVDGIGMHEFGQAPALVENGGSFEANAAMKVAQLRQWLDGNPQLHHRAAAYFRTCLLADDSGLEVDALNGAPGIRSARFAAAKESNRNAPDAQNNAKLLSLLKAIPDEKRTARFRCVLAALEYPQGSDVQLFAGSCEGRIAESCRGAGGFGYDPLFLPAGRDQSFAELSADTKNRISHRAQALAKLAAFLTASKTK